MNDGSTQELLRAWGRGEPEALDELVARLHNELRRISTRLMAREGSCLTLQPTAVVNEAYLRFRKLPRIRVESRQAFLGFAARVMRNVLVEFARARGAERRGGDVIKISVDGVDVPGQASEFLDMIMLDHALAKLERIDGRLVRQIELRFFSGLSERDVAEVLGISRATVQRDWSLAKRWLARHWLDQTDQPDDQE